MKKYVAGADIGGTTVKLGFFTTEGDLLEKWEIPTDVSDRADILKDMAESCSKKMESLGFAKEDFVGIGLGIPGPVLPDGMVNGCVNLGWGRKNVKAEMEEYLGIPAVCANDANMAALGEAWKGSGCGVNDVVMVTLGTGVGGGIVLSGKIVGGVHGCGGEIGHMNVNSHETVRCNCGKAGCLEQYCSATGIVNETRKALKKNKSWISLPADGAFEAKDIFDAAKAGDTFSKIQVDVFCKRFAKAFSLISAVVDPEMFIIGGGVSLAGEIITHNVARHFEEFAFGPQKEIRFVLASLGNDAGIYGCAKAILDA